MAGEVVEKIEGIEILTSAKNVEFKPYYIDDDQLSAIVRRSDFIFLPYQSGSGSAVCSVAAALETPVIASKLPVFEYMQENFNFLRAYRVLCPADVGLALAAGISDLRKERIDWSSVQSKLSMRSYSEHLLAATL